MTAEPRLFDVGPIAGTAPPSPHMWRPPRPYRYRVDGGPWTYVGTADQAACAGGVPSLEAFHAPTQTWQPWAP